MSKPVLEEVERPVLAGRCAAGTFTFTFTSMVQNMFVIPRILLGSSILPSGHCTCT